MLNKITVNPWIVWHLKFVVQCLCNVKTLAQYFYAFIIKDVPFTLIHLYRSLQFLFIFRNTTLSMKCFYWQHCWFFHLVLSHFTATCLKYWHSCQDVLKRWEPLVELTWNDPRASLTCLFLQINDYICLAEQVETILTWLFAIKVIWNILKL